MSIPYLIFYFKYHESRWPADSKKEEVFAAEMKNIELEYETVKGYCGSQFTMTLEQYIEAEKRDFEADWTKHLEPRKHCVIEKRAVTDETLAETIIEIESEPGFIRWFQDQDYPRWEAPAGFNRGEIDL